MAIIPPNKKNEETTAEKMLKSLSGIFSMQTKKGADLLATTSVPAQAFIQTAPLSNSFFNDLYGSADEFLNKYDQFTEKYYAALENKANHVKGSRVNIELMKKRGKIDLKLLTKEKADELYKMYSREVLQLDNLLIKGGLPGAELPSSNLYSNLLRFLTSADPNSEMHPAQLLLSRSYFAFNPLKTGMDSFTVSRNNILSAKSLRELTNQSAPGKGMFSGLAKGMKVITLDVETTGVFDFSQVRSMAAAESVYGPKGLSAPKTIENLAFDSPQLHGYSMGQLSGGSRSLSSFLAGTESGGNLRPMNSFLDETERFIDRLLQADRIAGHNVHFDLDKIVQTAMDMPEFASHSGMQRAIRELYGKIDEGNYLIDTLDYTRNYLDQQVTSLLEISKIDDVVKRSEAYTKNIFSQEILARVHIGGSASFASVENIALNTNLFELIERDGQAEELFQMITKGSHVADTDTHLQTYIANYVQSGELKIWPTAEPMKIGGSMQMQTEFGKFSRSKVYKSQAITPTTNLADIQHVSNNVYQYLMSDEGAKGISIEVANAGKTFGIDELENESAILTRSGGEFKLLTRDGFTQISQQQDQAMELIRTTLQRGALPDSDVIRVGKSTTLTNKANLSIIDLGVSVGAASRAVQMTEMAKIATTSDITDDALRTAFGSVYRSYGSGLSYADQARASYGARPRESIFQLGLGNFADNIPAQVAERFAAIGDPLYFIDPLSRSVSTVVAETTASIGNIANRKITRASGDVSQEVIDSVAFSANPKLTAELGISYFKAQERASMFRMAATEMGTSKIVAPTELLKEAFEGYADDTFKNISLSVIETADGPRVNLVWNVGNQLNKDQTRQMMGNLFDILSDDQRAANTLGVELGELNESIVRENQFVQSAAKSGRKSSAVADAIEATTETAMDRGIVFGYLDGPEAESLVESFKRLGLDMGNDVNIRNLTSRVLKTGLGKEVIALAPFVFGDAVKVAGLQSRIDDAFKIIDDGAGGRISAAVQQYNKIAQRIGSNKGLRTDISRGVKLAKAADGNRVLTEFYLKHKPKLGAGLLVSAIAGLGYYKAKKNREKALYEEAVEKMPYESGNQLDPLAELKEGYNFVPQRMNPLATAGVVGNLDRNKIGHYQMGTNKYDHLFGR